MRIKIDGQDIEATPGETILEVARRYGIHIPTLCFHEAFGGQGHCRLCMVEVKIGNVTRLAASCTYPITSEIEVRTVTPAIEKVRQNIIMLLYKRAQGSRFMQDLSQRYKCQENSLHGDPDERCILCRLCVNACAQIGASAISAVSRGIDKHIDTPYNEPAAACLGCGTCAAICPTGAIEMEQTGNCRTIWGKEFELVNCESCGQPFATREQLDYIATRTNGFFPRLCDRCRRQEVTRNVGRFIR